MCDEGKQLPNSAPIFNVNTSGAYVQDTALRYCSACLTWVTGYHSCQWGVSPSDAGFAAYKVYSSVSGKCFVILPGAWGEGLPGFNADSFMGPPKTPCATVADGKRIAEKHWRDAIGTVLAP